MRTSNSIVGMLEVAVGGVASLAFLLGASGCLELDTDRTCGAGEPACYQGEVCYQGRCRDRDEVPEGADVSESDTSSESDDTTTSGEDGDGEPDAGPADDSRTSDEDSGPDADDTGANGGDSGPRDGGSDAVAPTSCSPDPENSDFSWPDGTFCETLEQGTGSDDLCGLRDEWDKFESGDAGTSPPPSGRPGAECSDDSDCLGRCENIGTADDPNERCVHRMFTSSETFDGDFQSGADATDAADFAVQEADCACQLLALRAGREGRFQAVIGNEDTLADERIEVRTDIFAIDYSGSRDEWQSTTLYDRDKDSKSWFTVGSWENDPTFNEAGANILDQSADPVTGVWTGHPPSDPNLDHPHCDFWSTNSEGTDGTAGNLERTRIARFRDSTQTHPCDNQYRLYCIEQ